MGDLPSVELKANYLSPRHTAKLTVDASDREGANPGVAKVEILEDGNPIHTNNDHFIYTHREVTHQNPGRHSYQAMVTDNDGNVVRSNELVIQYTGYREDNLPRAEISANLPTCRKNVKLTVEERDSLDNQGIEWVKIFEDGQLIHTDKDHIIYTHREVAHQSPGEHTYHAQVKYKDGPVIETSPISVRYVGLEQTLLPSGDIETDLEQAGQTAKLTVDWHDKYDNEGVEIVRFFQDGKHVGSSNDPFLHARMEVQPETPGIHKYQAEIQFKNGHTIRTGELEVNFSGNVLDLPPRVDIRYDNEDNQFHISARDKGDNDGIANVVLYRDGEPVLTKENPDLGWITAQAEPPKDLGEAVFHAEVTDLGGNTVKSEEVRVGFKNLEEIARNETYAVVVDTNGRTFEQVKSDHDAFSPLSFFGVYAALAVGVVGYLLGRLSRRTN